MQNFAPSYNKRKRYEAKVRAGVIKEGESKFWKLRNRRKPKWMLLSSSMPTYRKTIKI